MAAAADTADTTTDAESRLVTTWTSLDRVSTASANPAANTTHGYCAENGDHYVVDANGVVMLQQGAASMGPPVLSLDDLRQKFEEDHGGALADCECHEWNPGGWLYPFCFDGALAMRHHHWSLQEQCRAEARLRQLNPECKGCMDAAHAVRTSGLGDPSLTEADILQAEQGLQEEAEEEAGSDYDTAPIEDTVFRDQTGPPSASATLHHEKNPQHSKKRSRDDE
eukprot:CAMPEP_0182582984 /NCGR_PEP_ID=MMETSP1324-20130603/53961_1 /TAXON_ID=236786 /ORGANISM="Florenciella sp., Strain RCC1587" /LENGTH=223 /DNA_ID=CAMNT_0024799501 /DNA_START=52 /DNA_END=723 /DNA_ORIENTATION=+